MSKEDQVNNSYQIIEEFKCKRHKIYHGRKLKCPSPPGEEELAPGPCKCLTEEEIFLYRLKKYGRLFKNLTV